MTITDDAPPPTATAPTLEERVHALGVTADRLAADLVGERAKSAAVIHDRDRLLDLNITLDARYQAALTERDDEIRDLLAAGRVKDEELARHRAAARARAALEAEAPRRAPSPRALLLAALAGALLTLGVAAAVTGFVVNQGGVIAAGAAVVGVSAGLLARICTADDPSHPFDLDGEAAGDE